MQFILGAQLLFLIFAMASAFHRITGAGTGVSLLIGGFGGFLVIYAIYRKFPKSVLGLAAGAWAIGGFMLGDAVFGSAGGTLILGLIGAAIGFGINAAWLADLDKDFDRSYAKGQAFTKAILPEIISQKDREGLVVLWHAVRRLDRMKVIDESTFKRLNGDIAGLLKMPNPPEGSAPMRINDVADGFEAVRLMQDNGMIGAAEGDTIRARIEARENEPRQPSRREPPGRAPMGQNPDGSLTDAERQIIAAYLPKLVENRALSPTSYARVMAVLEPRSAEGNLAEVEFPYEDSADTDDLETVERLYKARLIDAAEYRRGLQVILPYLHSAEA